MDSITLTFCECAENHAGMEKLGSIADRGIPYEILSEIKCENSEFVDLSLNDEKAGVLIIRNFIKNADNIFEEQCNLDVDKKCFMRGRVVNKHARWNLCFADFDQEPDYENKKGRVIDFKHIPETLKVRNKLNKLFNYNLLCEANYYYDVTKCGIGWHGDSERRVVIGLRLGKSFPLKYRWYKEGEPISEVQELSLNHGDIYIMSEKAVGYDWKRRKIPTLRHSAGCKKYTQ